MLLQHCSCCCLDTARFMNVVLHFMLLLYFESKGLLLGKVLARSKQAPELAIMPLNTHFYYNLEASATIHVTLIKILKCSRSTILWNGDLQGLFNNFEKNC